MIYSWLIISETTLIVVPLPDDCSLSNATDVDISSLRPKNVRLRLDVLEAQLGLLVKALQMQEDGGDANKFFCVLLHLDFFDEHDIVIERNLPLSAALFPL